MREIINIFVILDIGEHFLLSCFKFMKSKDLENILPHNTSLH